MKVFEVNETLVIDEKTKNISCWVVKDIHSGKVVFFVKDNEVLIADENYMKILMEIMEVPLINKEENDDPCEDCQTKWWDRGCDDCPYA